LTLANIANNTLHIYTYNAIYTTYAIYTFYAIYTTYAIYTFYAIYATYTAKFITFPCRPELTRKKRNTTRTVYTYYASASDIFQHIFRMRHSN
jgi:hypothetical protein